MGTVNYMSPEQASGLPVDYRSDQFAFGLILYELVSGKRAFQRESKAQTLAAIISEEPPPIEAKLPPPLRWMIERCMARNRLSGTNLHAISITIFEPSTTISPKPTQSRASSRSRERQHEGDSGSGSLFRPAFCWPP